MRTGIVMYLGAPEHDRWVTRGGPAVMVADGTVVFEVWFYLSPRLGWGCLTHQPEHVHPSARFIDAGAVAESIASLKDLDCQLARGV